MDFLEEIEFFGFVPVTYVNNLIKNTTDKAEEILKDENPVTRKEIITALNKNFQIFEVFVLKSIFKFPDSFSFERKVTDFNCDTEINNLICELTKILEEEENLKKEIFIKEKDLEFKILEGKEYDILLESEEKMKKLTEKVKEMEKIHLEAESSLKKLNKLTGSLKRRNQLTEFKNLKDAFWEKEKGFLFENISLAQIQFYNKNI